MSIRVVEPTCTECGAPLTDPASRAFRLGPECRKGMTTEQLREAMQRAAAADDPFRVPEERAPSVTALVNNHNARAAAAGDVKVCERHGTELGKCKSCARAHVIQTAAELIVEDILATTFEERRAERLRILLVRYAYVTPWRPAERPRKPQKPKTPPQDRPPRTAPPTGQMELS